MNIRQRISPALILLFLAPAIGEILTTSTPLPALLNLPGVIMLIMLYGCGALVVREIAFRWKKGWPTVLALGAAYGIIEEGILCQTFFNPAIGPLGSYGRFYGVNWVWAVGLTIFHSVFSIGISILLVWLAFPERRNTRWVTDRWLVAAGAAFVLVVVVNNLFAVRYQLSLLVYVLTILIAALVALLGLLAPSTMTIGSKPAILRARWLVPAGLFWGTALVFIGPVFSLTEADPAVPLFLLLIIEGGACLLLAWLYGKGPLFSDVHKLAIASGALGSLFVYDLLAAAQGAIGPGIAAVIAMALLVLLWYRLWGLERGRADQPIDGLSS